MVGEFFRFGRNFIKSPCQPADLAGSAPRVPIDGLGSGWAFPRASRRIQYKDEQRMADYIPGPDANFQAWQSNFVIYANANLAALGLVAADMTPVTTAQTGWTTAFPAH